MIRKFATGLLAGAAVTTALAFTAPAAEAATARNGVCETGEFCLYYNSDHLGSLVDFGGNVADYGTGTGCVKFVSGGSGQGQCVKNNAASAWNRTSGPVRVHYSSNYYGFYQAIASGVKPNLNASIKNDNASHRFGSPSFGTPNANPYGSSATRAPNATPRTQFVDDELARLTWERDCWVGDYRTYQSSTSNHNTGNALDCTISNAIGVYPTASQETEGWRIANWLRTHASRLKVSYVIWDGKIWSLARSAEGWRTYTAGTGVTGGHYDHVHVSIQNPYGD